ncbi:MAG: ammonium transporter [Gammaproteobacteria bacterium]
MHSHTRRLVPALLLIALASPAHAADGGLAALDVLVVVAAALVFFMQAGFALLEGGMVRAKNTVNVILKNFSDMSLGILAFWLVGFGLMFGTNSTGWFGTDGFAYDGADTTSLLYQMMFAATAATIVSGAVAERMRYGPYLLIALLLCGFVYPVFGSWVWGGDEETGLGWLSNLGFVDFAGSTVVHSMGAWAALAVVIVLGPRTGRFSEEGEARPVPGHNLPMVALGGFILWFGWFGFNGGSISSMDQLGPVLVNTQLGGAAGALGVILVSGLSRGHVLSTEVVNGSLGGLVAITAGAATLSPGFAILTGFIGGIVATQGAKLLLKMRIDDVVGAIPVHGFAGAWGTLATGMFYQGDLFNIARVIVQLIGIFAGFFWGFLVVLLLVTAINLVLPIRASTRHEQHGLDFTEHDEIGYAEFQSHQTHGEVRG